MALVVVAEDNLDHQRVIAEVVRRLGHDVVVANDGRTGLAAITKHRPDLIVADVDMPQLNGLELCQAVRDDPELTTIPVVLVTAYLLPGDPRLSATGAAGVIGKPFGVPELSEALRGHLNALKTPHVGHSLLDAVLDCVDTGVMAFDLRGRQLLVNRALSDVFGADDPGAPVEDVARRHRMRRPDGAELPAEEWPIWRAMRGEDVSHVELMTSDPHGRPHWYLVNARPVRDQDGRIVAAVSTAHDVTTRHRTRQYEVCKNKVLKVLSIHPDAPDVGDQVLAAIGGTLGWPCLRLWLADEESDMLRPAAVHNAPGEPSLPMPTAIGRGQGLAGLCWQSGDLIWVPDLHAPDAPVLPEVAQSDAYRSGGAVPVRSGERVVGAMSFFSRTRQEADPALGMLLTGIAALIGAFLEHRRAEVLALHLAAATDEYMALAGHELRTPLTSIGSYIDLIAESSPETPFSELRELFEVVHRNSTRLRELVDRLLDVAGLESGHIVLEEEPVDLTAVVTEALAPAGAGRDITIRRNRMDDVIVPGDRKRLRQVVEALVSNAVKFSPAESTVGVSLVDRGHEAVLTVSDTGVGVPAAEQPRLFRRLYRGGNARHTGIPGSGLGLALCRVVVERHRGTIALSSDEANGTTVTVRLPK
ncbi:ATP-binding protein [Actinoplanes sp. NPDC026619]|uniref:hybrid sensor histidine kinase/response regulator n=1 Tax=Actinoplanes sp. NPDC026619 TaxID=3155798 RepID=UPI00340E1276